MNATSELNRSEFFPLSHFDCGIDADPTRLFNRLNVNEGENAENQFPF